MPLRGMTLGKKEVVVTPPTSTSAKACNAAAAPTHGESAPRPRPRVASHGRILPPFWRHFLEMLAAMAVGMVATGAIFLFITGLKTWDDAAVQYPTQALLAIAAGMTIPMIAWMLFRHMGRRNAYEMAAAMVLPVIPFLCLVWFDITESGVVRGLLATTIAAMLAVMLYRRRTYSMAM
jgi:cytochrome bd-type quinol oxidase subunit 2